MLTAGGRFGGAFGTVPPGDQAETVRIVRGAVRAGFAVVLVKPGDKAPLCPLTPRLAKAADRRAAEEALSSGERNGHARRHACGIKHALVDAAAADRLTRRVLKQHGGCNIGVEPHASRMVAIDVDTPEQRAAFLAAWSAATGQDETGRTITVASPGTLVTGPDGTTRPGHHGGGHWWFYLPDGVELPTSPGQLTDRTGWTCVWAGHQLLVPPSRRPEGVYTLTGQAEDIPGWLLARIEQEVADAVERAGARARTVRPAGTTGPSGIDEWAALAPWDELLEPDGWVRTGKRDTCGCPMWTAPGTHASAKSATAHEPGCTHGGVDTSAGHGPLHLWTDNPPPELLWGRKRVTKLWYVALSRHAGDLAEACRALGLPALAGNVASFPEYVVDSVPAGPALNGAAKPSRSAVDGSEPAGGVRVPQNLPEAFWEARPVLRHIRRAAHSRYESADGVLLATLCRLSGMVPHQCRLDTGIGSRRGASLNLFGALVGPSGSGKSSAYEVSADLYVQLASMDLADGRPLGSGEGIAELYMGEVQRGTGETYRTGDRKGEEKTRPVRAQVRHNAFVFADEGEALHRLGERSGASLGETLRRAWRGMAIGQSNGVATTTRVVVAGSYSLGMLLGFQPSTAQPLLTDVDNGTPQRFLFLSATDRSIQDTAPPGEDPFEAAGPSMFGPEPVPLTLEAVIRDEIREDSLARKRGTREPAPLDAHGMLTRAKVAGLLALLDGRHHVAVSDWELAGVVWCTSCAVRDGLVEHGRGAAEAAETARSDRHVATQERVQLARGLAGGKLTRIATQLARKIHEKGAMSWGYLAPLVTKANRHLIREAVDYGLTATWLVEVDGKIAPGPSRPADP